MKSIRGRLCLDLFIVTVALTVAFAGGLFLYLRHAFVHQLDRSLKEQAILLSSAVEVTSGAGAL